MMVIRYRRTSLYALEHAESSAVGFIHAIKFLSLLFSFSAIEMGNDPRKVERKEPWNYIYSLCYIRHQRCGSVSCARYFTYHPRTVLPCEHSSQVAVKVDDDLNDDMIGYDLIYRKLCRLKYSQHHNSYIDDIHFQTTAGRISNTVKVRYFSIWKF